MSKPKIVAYTEPTSDYRYEVWLSEIASAICHWMRSYRGRDDHVDDDRCALYHEEEILEALKDSYDVSAIQRALTTLVQGQLIKRVEYTCTCPKSE